MKPLKSYLEDFLATPMNTIGMGDMNAELPVFGSVSIYDIKRKHKSASKKHRNHTL